MLWLEPGQALTAGSSVIVPPTSAKENSPAGFGSRTSYSRYDTLLFWFPLTPVAELRSKSAPATRLSSEISTEVPNQSPASVLEAFK